MEREATMLQLHPADAAHAVCTAMAQHDDEAGKSMVNIGSFEPPKGLEVFEVGRTRFAAMRDLAYYGAHGRVREPDDGA